MTTLRRITLTLGIAVFSSGMASAIPIIENCSTVSGPTELNGSSHPVTCPLLNTNTLPVGAIVNDIILTINGSITGTITLTNSSTNSNSETGTTLSDFILGGGGFGVHPSPDTTTLTGFSFPTTKDLANNPNDWYIFQAGYSTGPQTLNPTSSTMFGPFSDSEASGSMTNSNSATFGTYEGIGTFNIPIYTISGLNLTGGGGQAGGTQSTNASVTATVQYDYSIMSGVPEPTTMLLLGSALVGMGLLRKRVTR